MMGQVSLSGIVPKLTKPPGLPAGYTKLAYIQSSGTQYIDTGVKLTATLSAEFDYQVVSVTNNTWFFSVLYEVNGVAKSYWRAGIWGGAFTFSNMTASQTSDVTARTQFSGQSTMSCDLNIFLFAESRSTGAFGCNAGKMYSCQIYDNGTLVRDFVPCISNADTVGLYDLVEGKFYGNAGTGVFIGSEVA